jgi:hypothetical protein
MFELLQVVIGRAKWFQRKVPVFVLLRNENPKLRNESVLLNGELQSEEVAEITGWECGCATAAPVMSPR